MVSGAMPTLSCTPHQIYVIDNTATPNEVRSSVGAAVTALLPVRFRKIFESAGLTLFRWVTSCEHWRVHFRER